MLLGQGRDSAMQGLVELLTHSFAVRAKLVASDDVEQSSAVVGALGHRSVEGLGFAMFLASALINAQVAGNGVKPSRKLRLSAIVLGALDDAEEGLLEEILGKFARTHESQDEIESLRGQVNLLKTLEESVAEKDADILSIVYFVSQNSDLELFLKELLTPHLLLKDLILSGTLCKRISEPGI